MSIVTLIAVSLFLSEVVKYARVSSEIKYFIIENSTLYIGLALVTAKRQCYLVTILGVY